MFLGVCRWIAQGIELKVKNELCRMKVRLNPWEAFIWRLWIRKNKGKQSTIDAGSLSAHRSTVTIISPFTDQLSSAAFSPWSTTPLTFSDTLVSQSHTERIRALHLPQWVSSFSLASYYSSSTWLQSDFGSVLFYGKNGLINCELFFEVYLANYC